MNMLKNIYKLNFLSTSNFSTGIVNKLENTKYLGRWRIENEHKTNLKADYANDDHCGVCSGFTSKNIMKKKDFDDEYYSMFLIEFVQDNPSFKK